MKQGTKSVLFGAHQFIIHPVFVAIAWIKLYGFPVDPRVWIAFVIHDWGYWGKPNMDGAEGKTHPEWAANIMHALFDGYIITESCSNCSMEINGRTIELESRAICRSLSVKWYNFMLLHSRHYVEKYNAKPSRLCVADKMAFVITPRWLYMMLLRFTGELTEYVKNFYKIENEVEILYKYWYNAARRCNAEFIQDTLNYEETITNAGRKEKRVSGERSKVLLLRKVTD